MSEREHAAWAAKYVREHFGKQVQVSVRVLAETLEALAAKPDAQSLRVTRPERLDDTTRNEIEEVARAMLAEQQPEIDALEAASRITAADLATRVAESDAQPALYWHCECGKNEPAQADYERGDSEPCCLCEDGVARVVTIAEAAAWEQAKALGHQWRPWHAEPWSDPGKERGEQPAESAEEWEVSETVPDGDALRPGQPSDSRFRRLYRGERWTRQDDGSVLVERRVKT